MAANRPTFPGLERSNTEREFARMSIFASLFASKSVQAAGVVFTLMAVLIDWLCCFGDLCRWRLGERTLSPLRVFNSLLVMQAFWLGMSAAFYLLGRFLRTTPLAGFVDIPRIEAGVPPFLLAAFLLASAFHLWEISYRRRKGIRVHSFAAGISLIEATGLLDWANYLIGQITLLGWKIPFRFTRWHLYLFVEPLLCALIAYVLLRYDPITSIWLLICSGSMFIRAQLMAAQQRAALLDYWDAQLDSELMMAAAMGAPPTETAGIMVLPGFAEAFEHAEALDIAGRVDKTFASEE